MTKIENTVVDKILDKVKDKVYDAATGDPYMFDVVKRQVKWGLDGIWEDVVDEVFDVTDVTLIITFAFWSFFDFNKVLREV